MSANSCERYRVAALESREKALYDPERPFTLLQSGRSFCNFGGFKEPAENYLTRRKPHTGGDDKVHRDAQ